MSAREYPTLTKLRNGEVINFEGLFLEMDEGEIGPGDLYIGERNSTRFLTCKKVDHVYRTIIPTTLDYPFNINECIKVREAKEGPKTEIKEGPKE